MSTDERTYVGVDVYKAALEAAVLPANEHFVVPNDETGIDELLLGKLAEVSHTLLVVLEASGGGFERPLAATLAASEIALFVVDPR